MTEYHRHVPGPFAIHGRSDTVGRRAPFFAFGSAASRTAGSEWSRSYRRKLVRTDAIVVFLSVFGAFLISNPAMMGLTVPAAAIAQIPVIALIMVVWMLSLSFNHTRESRVLGVGAAEYKKVIRATVIIFGGLAITFLLAGLDDVRAYFFVTLPLGLGTLLVERWLWRRWLTRQRIYGHYLSSALVVGSLEDVTYVIRTIAENTGAVYDVLGVVLDEPTSGSITVGSRTFPVVSGLDHVAQAASNTGANAVIVAGQPHGGSGFLRDLAWDLEGTRAELVVASRLTNVAGPRIHLRPVEGLPLMHVELPHFEGGKHVIKRLFDIVVSGMALLVLAPILAVVALMVRRDSEGPVLFRQERVGREGRTFQMVKFRSMCSNAEAELSALMEQNEGSGVLFKLKDDPRVTRVGRVLRKYSLDELPQLWNILVGDMSLVGPRPPLLREVVEYEDHVHRRLYIRPGLTGLWQVSGRSDLSWEESVRLDLYYVENWSLVGDLVLMWRTVKTVLKPSGAY